METYTVIFNTTKSTWGGCGVFCREFVVENSTRAMMAFKADKIHEGDTVIAIVKATALDVVIYGKIQVG